MTRGETFVSGTPGVAVLAGGLALAAALFLAPDAARAQEECGALNSGNSYTETCADSNSAYTDGIVYDAQANSITLTVTGGTATMITASTGAHNGRDSGIFLRTASSATNAPISLTVGSGGDVVIVQGSSPDSNARHKNNGITVAPLTTDGSATTVDIRSGVTIGTSSARMANSGVYVYTTQGGGDVSVESAATIWSTHDGIKIENPAGAYTTAGTVSVTNSDTVNSNDDAINVEHKGTGPLTVTNRGALTSAGTASNDHGIYVYSHGKDTAGVGADLTITQSAGTISADAGGHGIAVFVEGGAAHDTGLAKVEITGGSVLSKRSAIRVSHKELGSAEVNTSSGVTLTATEGHGIDVDLATGNTSRTISITNAATITAGTTANTGWYGISASRQVGSGAITVTNSGAVTSYGIGIYVGAGGAGGTVTVTNRGAIMVEDDGINVEHSASAGDVVITSSGAITSAGTGGYDHGIYAYSANKDTAGTSAGISVTHSAGTISAATGGSGIAVFMGDPREEADPDHADYAAPENTGLAKVEVTGGSVRSKGSAIRVRNTEAGSVEVNVGTVNTETGNVDAGLPSDITLTATEGHGIEAELTDVGNTSGAISVTSAAAITVGTTENTGYHGIYVYRAGGRGTGGVSVTSSGDVTAQGRGHGIYASVGGTGLAKVEVTGGSVRSGKSAIRVRHRELGSAEVRVSSGAALTAADGHGIEVELAAGNTSRTISITNAGTITAGTTANTGWYGISASRQVGSGAITVTNEGAVTAHGNGIYVGAGGAGGAVTVTNRGAITTKEAGDGINVEHSATAGDVAITSSGDVTAKRRGIYVSKRGSEGAVSITRTGGAVTADDVGISVDHHGAAGDTTIVNRGAITSANAQGIYVFSSNKDAAGTRAGISVTHSAGTISAPGDLGIGVYLGGSREETNPDHADYVAPVNTGLVKVEVTGGSIDANGGAIQAFNNEAGSVEVTVSEGVTLTSREDDGIAARLTDVGNTSGTLTVTNKGTIRANNGYGISALTMGRGALSVTNEGAIEAREKGIIVDHHGTAGDVTIVNSANIETPEIEVIETWAIEGIYAFSSNKDAPGTSAGISVTHSAGTISAEGSYGTGIGAWLGLNREETTPDHADYVAPVNTGLVKVAVTGGSIQSRSDAVIASNREAGSVEVTVSEGATLTATEGHGINAELTDVGNAGGTISITQAGALSASADGISAKVTRRSAVAAPDRPAIDIVWTGTFTALDSQRGRFRNLTRAVAAAAGRQAVEEEKADIRFARGSAGIDAGVMKWQSFMRPVSRGDDPGRFADKAAQDALFAEDADAATRARAAAIVAQLRSVLTDESLGTIPGADAIDTDDDDEYSDAEIAAYLSEDDDTRRILLRNILAQSFTEEEMAVFRAVIEDGDVEAALAAAPDSYGDAWKAGVRALLAHHNDGNIRIAMNGGSIASGGDGIRAFFGRSHADNGRIDVTVAEGASVTGGMAGVYVANAGDGLRIEKRYTSPAIQAINENLGPDDLVTLPDYPHQVVRVDGTVTGGTDAAVHLAGGGALIVKGTGRLVAGSSGRAILVNDPGPAVIYIEGEVRGGEGAQAAVHLTGGGSVTVGPVGRVEANGADAAIRADNEPTGVIILPAGDGLTQKNVRAAADRVVGGVVGDGVANNKITFIIPETVDGVRTGNGIDVDLDEEGNPRFAGNSAFEALPLDEEDEEPSVGQPDSHFCNQAAAGDAQCRLYEALPSVLLAMNDLPTYAERMSAARDGKGGWARVETVRGKWKADSSTRTDVAYDHRRHGVRAGMDFAVGEAGRVGVSVHGLRGSAEMASPRGGNNEVDLSGGGLGVNATAAIAGDVHVDARAAVTRYDVDLKAATLGSLKKDAKGSGYALGVEVGRRMSVADGVSVTPRVDLLWSKVDMDDFTQQVEGSTVSPRISVKDADSLVGRVGMMMETRWVRDTPGRIFGSVDVEHEFKDETSVNVAGTLLETTARATGVRLGLGGELSVDEGVVLRARADYTTSGSGTNEFGGGVELNVRF